MCRRCWRTHAFVNLCASIPMGEGMLRFVSIVKAPQVSCAFTAIVSFIKEGPTYSTHGSERRCA